MEYHIDPITACAILQGWCKDNFCQITKCFLLHTYFMPKGHYINDTSRRLRDYVSWWNLFFKIPFIPLHISISLKFLDLIFASVSSLRILRLILLYLFCCSQMTCRHLLPLSWHVLGHLKHLQMQQMQWRERLSQKDSCRTMNWPNYFPIDLLATCVAQDLLEQYQMNHMPQIPEADFSILKSYVISAHYTGIETESLLCVFVISSVVWSTRILPNGFDYPIC